MASHPPLFYGKNRLEPDQINNRNSRNKDLIPATLPLDFFDVRSNDKTSTMWYSKIVSPERKENDIL